MTAKTNFHERRSFCQDSSTKLLEKSSFLLQNLNTNERHKFVDGKTFSRETALLSHRQPCLFTIAIQSKSAQLFCVINVPAHRLESLQQVRRVNTGEQSVKSSFHRLSTKVSETNANIETTQTSNHHKLILI